MKRLILRVVPVIHENQPTGEHAFQIIENDILVGDCLIGAGVERLTIYPKHFPLGTVLALTMPEKNEKLHS